MESDNRLIHVRFSPSGTVVEIGERPDALTPQQWFNFLSLRAANAYQALAGGRGVFRLAEGSIEALKTEGAGQAA